MNKLRASWRDSKKLRYVRIKPEELQQLKQNLKALRKGKQKAESGKMKAKERSEKAVTSGEKPDSTGVKMANVGPKKPSQRQRRNKEKKRRIFKRKHENYFDIMRAEYQDEKTARDDKSSTTETDTEGNENVIKMEVAEQQMNRQREMARTQRWQITKPVPLTAWMEAEKAKDLAERRTQAIPLTTKRHQNQLRFEMWFSEMRREDARWEMLMRRRRELAENEVLPSKRRFRSLVEGGPITRDEWEMMGPYADWPELAVILVEMRRNTGRRNLELKQRRCLICENFLNGVPLRNHTSEECPIMYQHRYVYINRRYGSSKCLECGLLLVNCRREHHGCKRCKLWKQQEILPHTQHMSICELIQQSKYILGREPSGPEISLLAERDAERAERFLSMLKTYEAEVEWQMLQIQRANISKAKAEAIWWEFTH
ncbi:hypothetical protein B9Z55_021492 [Caenorhabditis nigoni]|uniref:Uncharacterized protein n=1 Tax=Caenorhabditis nigoni TaxID=1611254 RepID=A0A2G5TS62_9PELO|nr:hypothetical protein B9Z55_021492 [Caenorhabditis nigoni]